MNEEKELRQEEQELDQEISEAQEEYPDEEDFAQMNEPNTRNDITVIKTMKKQFPREMTAEEVKKKAVTSSRLGAEIRNMKAEMKCRDDSWKAEKKQIEAEIEAAAARREVIDREIEIMKIYEMVECQERKLWDSRKVHIVRMDTGEIISERDFTEADSQTEIPFADTDNQESANIAGFGSEAHKSPQSDSGANTIPGEEQNATTRQDMKLTPEYIDALGRELFISDGGTGNKWSTYTHADGGGMQLYDKDDLPPVDSIAEAIENLNEYAEENNLELVEKTLDKDFDHE